jgi:hypothetical protein
VNSSVADPDPGSGAFLTPGTGIDFLLDPGSRIPNLYVYESSMTIFWVKSTIILSELSQNFSLPVQK